MVLLIFAIVCARYIWAVILPFALTPLTAGATLTTKKARQRGKQNARRTKRSRNAKREWRQRQKKIAKQKPSDNESEAAGKAGSHDRTIANFNVIPKTLWPIMTTDAHLRANNAYANGAGVLFRWHVCHYSPSLAKPHTLRRGGFSTRRVFLFRLSFEHREKWKASRTYRERTCRPLEPSRCRH